jgi:hypothetical protein
MVIAKGYSLLSAIVSGSRTTMLYNNNNCAACTRQTDRTSDEEKQATKDPGPLSTSIHLPIAIALPKSINLNQLKAP